nr:phosphonate metabolism transcriptional regulator PhnF [Sulfitobacter algicola]
MAGRFGVNRHTIRRALAEMAQDGLVHSRRGAGVFVTTKPTDYAIGQRVRFHQNLRAAGRTPEKQILMTETRNAAEKEALALQIAPGEAVHVYEGLSLADGQPIATFRSIFSAQRFPDFLTHLLQTQSVTSALRKEGIDDYIRATTRLTAKQANATQALHLRISEGAPILRTVSVNVDMNSRPIEYGHSWFAGDRVTLTVYNP